MLINVEKIPASFASLAVLADHIKRQQMRGESEIHVIRIILFHNFKISQENISKV